MREPRRLDVEEVEVDPGQIATGVIIGKMSEHFVFFVFGIASVTVFPRLFFPMADRLAGSLYACAIFALAFVARPFGSLLFAALDRRHGRVAKVVIAMFLLGGCTAAIGFLPGYAQIGPMAICLLALCRIGQGLALAGTWDGLAGLVILNAPAARRGWYAMMPQLGAPLGLLLASGMFAYFASALPPEDFFEWGWRFPFLAAVAVNVVALFARLRLVTTEAFAELFAQGALTPAPASKPLKAQARDVVAGALAPLASLAMFYLVTLFPISWIALFTSQSSASFLGVEIAGAGVGLLGVVASGPIADRIGRRKHLALGALSIAAFSLLAPWLLAGGPAGAASFVLVGSGLLGLSFGQAVVAVSSNFPREYRHAGAALAWDISWLVGAAFAPLAALGLSSRFGPTAVGAYLFAGAICTLIALTMKRPSR